MKTYFQASFVAFAISISAHAELNMDLPKEEIMIEKIPAAKTPITGELVKLELQAGSQYKRNMCVYMRLQAASKTGWGYKEEVNLGLLWQYEITSTVLHADRQSAVEFIVFGDGKKSGLTQIQSKASLETNLHDSAKELITNWNENKGNDAMFNAAEAALCKKYFLGIPIKQNIGPDVVRKSQNDTIRCVIDDKGLTGTSWLVVYNFDEKNNPPLIERMADDPTNAVKWVAFGTEAEKEDQNRQTRNMKYMVSRSCMAIDRSILQGDELVPDFNKKWTTTAKSLIPLIEPMFYRIDRCDGKVIYITADSYRKFNGEQHILVAFDKNQEELKFAKDYTDQDSDSDDEMAKNYGSFTLVPKRLEMFIEPRGGKSNIKYLFCKSTLNLDAQKNTWGIDPKSTASVDLETLYHCNVSPVKEYEGWKLLRPSLLTYAKKMRETSQSVGDCPWDAEIQKPVGKAP